MPVELLVAEIGSTTTLVSAFEGINGGGPRFLGQGWAPTTVAAGDVTVGLQEAIKDLGHHSLPDTVEMMASSSAAGGLRMTVHGLVYDMTVKAAREAALGAGAVIRLVTAGELQEEDLRQIEAIKPNIILLAGGVDYGERSTVLHNARRLAELGLPTPVIYAGNVAAREEATRALRERGIPVAAVENVYPRLDVLNIEPTRRAIQEVFERHIVSAPGMDRIRELVRGTIVPTPGAVMNAARLLYARLGDLMVVDVGGATTDVHSVTEGSEEVARLLVSPEPVAKRTVEGDLGVFLNARQVVERIGRERLEEELGFDLGPLLEAPPLVPQTAREVRFVERLTEEAVHAAVARHAGRLKYLYGPTGRTTVAEGKDLTRVKWIIGTGGPLTRLPAGREILGKIARGNKGMELYPGPEARVLLDRDYILAAAGVMAGRYPEAAAVLALGSLGVEA